MQWATKSASRVHEGTIGAASTEVAHLHPPTLTLSLTLTTVGDEDFTDVTTVGCAQSLELKAVLSTLQHHLTNCLAQHAHLYTSLHRCKCRNLGAGVWHQRRGQQESLFAKVSHKNDQGHMMACCPPRARSCSTPTRSVTNFRCTVSLSQENSLVCKRMRIWH